MLFHTTERQALKKLRAIGAQPAWLQGTRTALAAYLRTRPFHGQARGASLQPTFSFSPSLVGLTVVVLVAVGATGAAAQQALPTDVLYPVKLATERAQLAFTIPTPQRVAVQLRHADERLHEAQALTGGGGTAQALTDTLSRYEAEVTSAVALAITPALGDGEGVPAQVRARLLAQQRSLERLNERAREASDDGYAPTLNGSSARRARVAVLRAIKSSSESELVVIDRYVAREGGEPAERKDSESAQDAPPTAALGYAAPQAESSLSKLAAPAVGLPEFPPATEGAAERDDDGEDHDAPGLPTPAVAAEAELKLAEAEAVLASIEVESPVEAPKRVAQALERAREAVARAHEAVAEASARGTLSGYNRAYREVLKAYQLALTAEIASVNSEGGRHNRETGDD